MPALYTLLTFFGISILLGLSPGPDNLFVLLESAQRGWRAGLCVVLGLCIGLVVQTLAVALGLAALVAASATAFVLLKGAGAAYLLWLARDALGASMSKDEPLVSGKTGVNRRMGRWRMVGRGVVMNLSNPKVLVFFLAFLPQFVEPQRGAVAGQIAVLGAVFIGATWLVFGAIAVFSGYFGAYWMRSSSARRWLHRGAALVFAGLAVHLIVV